MCLVARVKFVKCNQPATLKRGQFCHHATCLCVIAVNGILIQGLRMDIGEPLEDPANHAHQYTSAI